jgi:hypothetical protein
VHPARKIPRITIAKTETAQYFIGGILSGELKYPSGPYPATGNVRCRRRQPTGHEG